MGIITNFVSSAMQFVAQAAVGIILVLIFSTVCEFGTDIYYEQNPEKLVAKYEAQIGVAYPYGYLKDAEISNPVTDSVEFVGEDGENILLISNPAAGNPTYSELCTFLAQDRTNEHAYTEGQFTCGEFAERLHNNAEYAGITCGWVSIDFAEGPGHACNVFETTDKGTVYIDCTGYDAAVDLQVGEHYKFNVLFENYELEAFEQVTNYDVFW